MDTKQVVITREKGEGASNGVLVNPNDRVFVTGPHFGRAVFSSTKDPAQASRYDADEAEAILSDAGRHWREARIEDIPT